MNLRAEILDYLAAGQATAGALSESLAVHPQAVAYQLKRLLAEDAITAHPIADSLTCPKGPLTVYRLSYATKPADH